MRNAGQDAGEHKFAGREESPLAPQLAFGSIPGCKTQAEFGSARKPGARGHEQNGSFRCRAQCRREPMNRMKRRVAGMLEARLPELDLEQVAQLHVEHDQIRPLALDLGERARAVLRGRDGVATLLQVVLDERQ